ncbi:hypothetical protein QY886_00365 [Latilactobacillus sakei]
MDNADPSKPTTETITGAKLSFDNTQYGQTQQVAELTKDTQDATYTSDVASTCYTTNSCTSCNC